MRPERPDERRAAPRGRNEVEDPKRSAGLRHAAAGLEGSAAHTAHRERKEERLRRALARRLSEPAPELSSKGPGDAPGIEARRGRDAAWRLGLREPSAHRRCAGARILIQRICCQLRCKSLRSATDERGFVAFSDIAIGRNFCDSKALSASALRGLYNLAHARPMAGRRHHVQGSGLKVSCRCVRRL